MGVITGYSRRTAAIGSGGGGGGAINTIYSGSDTITDDARTVNLKSGGTATQNLKITNGIDDIIKFRGDKQIIIGNNGIKFDPYGITNWAILQYLAAGTTYVWNVYDASNQEIFRFGSGGSIYARHTSGISSFMNYNSFINFWASGTSSSIGFVQDNGSNHTVYIGNSGGHGYVDIKNSSGVTKNWLIANGDSYFLNNLAIGGSSAAARFDVKGPGSTSATTTAFFQNSSSVAALKVKDDLYCIFRAKDAVIPDADLSNNELSFYIEEATNDLHFKVKYSTGTVKIGKVNLI